MILSGEVQIIEDGDNPVGSQMMTVKWTTLGGSGVQLDTHAVQQAVRRSKAVAAKATAGRK